jgi:hypothetical protein
LRYRINGPQVISETVGGETIIVNLASGHYFNLQGTAVDIWEGITQGETSNAIVARLASRYAGADGEIEEAVATLLADLAAAELVVPEDDNGGGGAAVEVIQDGSELPPFTPPTFATHTDMQDIILLDPVHEVDARGWPHATAGA